MSTLLTVLLTYLSIGVIIVISISYFELKNGVDEFDSKPIIVFKIVKFIVGWLPLIIKVYILD